MHDDDSSMHDDDSSDDSSKDNDEDISEDEDDASKLELGEEFCQQALAGLNPLSIPSCRYAFTKNFNLAIVYNDALTSKLYSSTEPVEIPNCINEFDLKDETSFSECDEEEQNILYFNDLFPFNIIYPDNSKSDKDNDDHEIDIKQSLRGKRNAINTDDGVYAHGSNKLLETSHDKSNNFFKAETFIKELNVNIMTWNHLNKGMSFIFLNKEFVSVIWHPVRPQIVL
ncbi:hypothetical protein Tco_0415134 [Tanacetum coccineum]